MREWRLRTLLMSLLLTTIVTTFVLVAVAILLYRLPQIEQNSREQAQLQALGVMRLVEQAMEGVEGRLQTVATLVPGKTTRELQSLLDASLAGGSMEALYLVSASGQVTLAAVSAGHNKAVLLGIDLSNDTFFRAAWKRHDRYWSDRFVSYVGEHYTVALAVPAGDQLLIAEINRQYLIRTVESVFRHSTLPVLVLDRVGAWIADYHMAEEDRLYNWGQMAERWQSGAVPDREMLYLGGVGSHLGIVHSDKMDWNFLVGTPAGFANSSYRAAVVLVVGGMFGAIILAIVLAPLWARLVVRPVLQMSEQMREVIEGNYWKQLPRCNVSEINQFAGSLEQMAEAVLMRQRDAERSEERLRATLENSPNVAVQWFSGDGVVLYWNRASELLYGFSAEEAVGQTLDRLILSPEAFRDFLDILRRVRRTGEAVGPQEILTRHRDGRTVIILSTIFAIPGEDGKRQFVCMDVDVTAMQRATQALQASEQRFQSIFEASPLPMAVLVSEPGVCDPQSGCRVVDVNQSWLEKFGRQRQDVVGRGLAAIGLWSAGETCEHCVARMLETHSGGKAESWLLRADGSPLLCEMSVQPVDVGEQKMLVWVLNDITDKRIFEEELRQLNQELEARVERRTEDLARANSELSSTLDSLKLAQHELVHAEKLAALGGVVAGVAHELNTPIGNGLMAISTLASQLHLFQRGMAEGLRRSVLESFMQDVDTGIDIALRNLERAADLVSSFKQVAVDQTSSQRRSFDLREVVDEILVTLHPMLKRTPYSIAVDVPAGFVLDSYPGPLGQVITNLVNNSVLHGFAGREQGEIRIRAEGLPDDKLRLLISDDGVGIAAEVRERIFEPFVTTRRGQGGTGLGLHISYNAVTSILGGQISVSSAVGAGTEFTLTLPLTAPYLEETSDA